MLKAITKPKNEEDKFAVVLLKDDYLVGHLSKKDKPWTICKNYFLPSTSL